MAGVAIRQKQLFGSLLATFQGRGGQNRGMVRDCGWVEGRPEIQVFKFLRCMRDAVSFVAGKRNPSLVRESMARLTIRLRELNLPA